MALGQISELSFGYVKFEKPVKYPSWRWQVGSWIRETWRLGERIDRMYKWESSTYDGIKAMKQDETMRALL